MMVLRLVVLAVLIYIGWTLLKGILGPGRKGGKQPPRRGSQVQDVLVEDPVCHTLVPKHQAVRVRKDGSTHYFCSEACADKFNARSRGST